MLKNKIYVGILIGLLFGIVLSMPLRGASDVIVGVNHWSRDRDDGFLYPTVETMNVSLNNNSLLWADLSSFAGDNVSWDPVAMAFDVTGAGFGLWNDDGTTLFPRTDGRAIKANDTITTTGDVVCLNLDIEQAISHVGGAEVIIFENDRIRIICGGMEMLRFVDAAQDVVLGNAEAALGSADVDFDWYQKDTETSFFTLDALNAYVGINKAVPVQPLDVVGNTDITGTLNVTDVKVLDGLGVEGTSFFNDTVTVIGDIVQGVDGTGYDTVLYGNTAGTYFLWDESRDMLILSNDYPNVAYGVDIVAFQKTFDEVDDINARTMNVLCRAEANAGDFTKFVQGAFNAHTWFYGANDFTATGTAGNRVARYDFSHRGTGTITFGGSITSSTLILNGLVGTITEAYNINLEGMDAEDGTIEVGKGLRCERPEVDTGLFEVYSHIWIDGGASVGSGDGLEQVGLNITDMTGFDDNFAIKTGLGRVEFGDDVTAPTVYADGGNLTHLMMYAELSDNTDQTFPSTGNGYVINFSTTDEIDGISHVAGEHNITIVYDGVYQFVAQPQIHADPGASGYFHMWFQKDTGGGYVDIANTNIEITLASNDERVGVLCETMRLDAGDRIRIVVSVSNTGIELDAQTPAGEPAIPSIILSVIGNR